MDDFDEVLLRFHDRVNGLVGHGSFVDYVFILAALDALRGGNVVCHGEAPLGLSARHRAPRAVAATVKTLRVSLAAHDVRARAHAAGNDSHIAFAGAYCALAGD